VKAALLALALAACGSAAATHPPKLPVGDAPPRAGETGPEADLSLPVVRITVTGLDTYRAADARARITTAIGAPVDPVQLRRDEDAIWRLGHIADLVVRAEPADGGVALFFEVRESPRMAFIDIEGAAHTQLVDAYAELGFQVSGIFDPAVFASGRNRLIDAYRDAGFPFAEVTWTVTEPSDANTVEVKVKVVEGNLVEIRSITVRGNARFTEAEVLASIAQAGGASVGEPFRAGVFRTGAYYLNADYYDDGYIDVKIGDVEVSYDSSKTKADLVIPIDEGAQYKIGKITVDKAYAKALGVKSGEVFSRSKLQAGITAIQTQRRQAGDTTPEVTPLTDVDPDKHVIDLKIAID
jgi:outer membrane protein insertion porin family